MSDMDDQREIELALADVASHLDYPKTPDLALVVAARLRAEPSRRPRPVPRPRWRLAVAALVVVLLAAAVLGFSPAARDAVADWLGLRGVRIKVGPVPTTSPGPAGIGRDLRPGDVRTTLEGARARVAFRVLVPTASRFQHPDEVYAGDFPPGGEVAFIYRARPGLPAATATGVGLLVTEFQGRVERDFLSKFVGQSGQLEQVTIDGEPGFWITGQVHEIAYLDAQGNFQQDQIRLAADTLVWEHKGLTLRLEGRVSKQEALRIAVSMR